MEGQGKDINSHYDPAKGLSICAWVKVIKTATDKHGQTRQPIVMKGAGGAWEFALYVYDDLKAATAVQTPVFAAYSYIQTWQYLSARV